jgi:ribose 5-phosphate isomerase B
MKIAIGSDHAGFELKEYVKGILLERQETLTDVGTNGPESVDYADFGLKVAELVSLGEVEKGILICGTGEGMSIIANKVKGIRAANCDNSVAARFSRLHNDANILTMGARIIGTALAADILIIWLNTEFEGGRHALRIEKVRQIEERSGVN